MKQLLLRHAIVFLLLLGATVFARADALYSRTIHLPAGASVAAKDSTAALQRWLGKVTGAEFTVAEFTVAEGLGKDGICLALESTPGLPVDVTKLKAQQSGEAFLIAGDGKALWIVGKTDVGLDRGVFYYLDTLGCRWLLPSEKWAVIPHRDEITLKVNGVQAPAFFTRDFFGSGGFGRPTYDPKQRIAEGWALYKRQNLLGGTFRLGGHTGEHINLTYKKELEAHPEYVAEVNGERKLTAFSKLCVSNPGLRELFVKDRLAVFKQQLARDPATLVVSVEPADGGGHCACAECVKLGSVSDRVFTLANVTARAVAKELPGKYVNLLAYNEHAPVPNIPLEPNVIVQLAPYAFQRTGLTPHEMIEAWGKKHDFLGVYTYWNIPDWVRCLPGLSTEFIADEIRFWQRSNIKLHSSESTFCGGNMGLNWYLAARLMWNPARDEKAIEDEYFTVAYSEAKAPIRRMNDRWESSFTLTDHELGQCYRDVNEALALAKDPAVRARLIDQGRYVHYLRLWYEYTTAKGEAKVEAAKAVLTYLWKVYDSNMVQSFRLAQLLGRDMKPHLDEMHNQAAMWKDIPQHTDEEILAFLAEGTAKYQPLDFTPKGYGGALTPLFTTAATNYITTSTFTSSSNFAFAVRPEATGRVTLKINIGNTPGRTDRILVTDPKGAAVFDQRLEASGQWADLDIPIATAGVYTLAVTDQKNGFSLQTPANLPFVNTGPYLCPNLSTRTYFYVPRGQRSVAVYSPSVIPIFIYDPNGKKVTVERNEQGNALFVIDVPEGMDGKVWSFARYKSYAGLCLLNAPSVFAFSPEAMMVPAEAIR